ncbi:MAG: T9SS type A sorting domain-containing protein [Bacteroidales bacterium]|nr:T9SS type A sorting domain-containing protein [Bacteroidales bacterium]
MRKIIFITLLLAHVLTAHELHAQRYMAWNKNITSASALDVSAMTSHKDNIYSTGIFSDSLNIDNRRLVSKGLEDVFVIKYDKEGNMLWLSHLGGIGRDCANAILVNQDAIFVGGSISDTIDDKEKEKLCPMSLFVSSWDTTGRLTWQTKIPFTGMASLDMLAQGPDSSIVAGGIIRGSLSLPQETLSSNSGRAFVAQLSSGGDIIGYASSKGSGQHRTVAATMQPNGNLMVMFAATQGSFELEGSFLNHKYDMKQNGLLIVNFSPTFQPLWSTTIESNGFVEGVKLIVDNENIVIAGVNYNGKLTINNNKVLHTDAQLSAALVRFDAQGRFIDLQTVTNKEYCRLKDFAPMENNNILLTGYFNGPSPFADTIVHTGRRNAFIAQLNPKGSVVWHDAFQLDNDYTGRATCIGPVSSFIFGGTYRLRSGDNSNRSNNTGLQHHGLFVNYYKNCESLPISIIAPTMMCHGDTLVLEVASVYAHYSWEKNKGHQNTYEISIPGTYTVYVMDKNGCPGADTITIGTYPPTRFVFGSSAELAKDDFLELSVDSIFSTYSWADDYQGRNRLVTFIENIEKLELGLTVQEGAHCPVTDTIVITFINETKQYSFDVYPIPAGDVLYWSWSGGEEQKIHDISVIDSRGSVKYQKSLATICNDCSGQIYLNSYGSGNYVLSLTTERGIFNRSFVKQ